jgi:ATP-dependent DNA helicase RecG
MISLDSPITDVLGERPKGPRGRKHSVIVDGMGLHTVGDLLRHVPRRYLKTGELTRVGELVPGQMLTVVGEIASSELKSYQDRRSRRMAYRVEAVLHTDGADLRMTFFAKNKGMADWQASRYPVGRQGIFVGQVSRFGGAWQLTNPKAVLFGADGPEDPETTQILEGLRGLYPIYPVSKGVQSWDLQRAVTFARTVLDDVRDVLPDELRAHYSLPDVRAAYDKIHAPADFGEVAAARRYFAFEEALVTQLLLARRRAAVRAVGAQRRSGGGAILAAFDDRLPFALTDGQRAVGATIEAELARPWPMSRLLQGEVGSGKTVVALRAMLRVVDSGGQAVLLAPTEVLAQQHHRSICQMLGELGQAGMLDAAAESTGVALLTGSVGATQRREALRVLKSGEAGIVIGTHALLEESVVFADLGLVVVDEQHRFGVEQRAALTAKAEHPPHLLVMTATPIPRTVAMTVFGDLEISTLSELPAGRGSIQSTVVPLAEKPAWMPRVWERITEEVAQGRQAYVVCSRIAADEFEQGMIQLPAESGPEESGPEEAPPEPEEGLATVVDTAAQVSSGPLADLRVGVLHGRLSANEKDTTMREFSDGEIDVLIATTVIEVGVDVPNATMMAILDADRFGVSQLHQIRGRIGRGGHESLCLLVTRAEPGSAARERIDAVAASSDGFELARVDLEQRREGDVLGSSQAGYRSGLRSLRVLRDEDTIVAARREAELLLDAHPDLSDSPELAAAVAELERSVASGFMEKS